MRLLELAPRDDRSAALRFHPRINVLTGHSPAVRRAVAGALRGNGGPNLVGLVEVQGVVIDLDTDLGELLDLSAAPDPMLRTEHVPTEAIADSSERRRRVQSQIDVLDGRRQRIAEARGAVVEALDRARRACTEQETKIFEATRDPAEALANAKAAERAASEELAEARSGLDRARAAFRTASDARTSEPPLDEFDVETQDAVVEARLEHEAQEQRLVDAKKALTEAEARLAGAQSEVTRLETAVAVEESIAAELGSGGGRSDSDDDAGGGAAAETGMPSVPDEIVRTARQELAETADARLRSDAAVAVAKRNLVEAEERHQEAVEARAAENPNERVAGDGADLDGAREKAERAKAEREQVEAGLQQARAELQPKAEDDLKAARANLADAETAVANAREWQESQGAEVDTAEAVEAAEQRVQRLESAIAELEANIRQAREELDQSLPEAQSPVAKMLSAVEAAARSQQVDPAAGPLADRLTDLIRRRASLTGPTLEQQRHAADTVVAAATAAVAAAQERAKPRQFTPEEIVAVEQAHDEMLKATSRAEKRFMGAKAQTVARVSIERLRSVLGGLGLGSYKDFEAARVATTPTPAALADVADRERDLARAVAARQQVDADASQALAALDTEYATLHRKAVELLGTNPGETLIVELRRVATGGTELGAATSVLTETLRSHGVDPGADVVAAARSYLAENDGAFAARRVVEEHLASAQTEIDSLRQSLDQARAAHQELIDATGGVAETEADKARRVDEFDRLLSEAKRVFDAAEIRQRRHKNTVRTVAGLERDLARAERGEKRAEERVAEIEERLAELANETPASEQRLAELKAAVSRARGDKRFHSRRVAELEETFEAAVQAELRATVRTERLEQMAAGGPSHDEHTAALAEASLAAAAEKRDAAAEVDRLRSLADEATGEERRLRKRVDKMKSLSRSLATRRLADLDAAVEAAAGAEATIAAKVEGLEASVAEAVRAQRRAQHAIDQGVSGTAIADPEDAEALELARARVTRLEQELAAADQALDTATKRLAALEPTLDEEPQSLAPDAGELVDQVEFALLSRLSHQRSVGRAGSIPLVVDDALAALDSEVRASVLTRLERLSVAVQIVYFSDDPSVVEWAEGLGSTRASLLRA